MYRSKIAKIVMTKRRRHRASQLSSVRLFSLKKKTVKCAANLTLSRANRVQRWTIILMLCDSKPSSTILLLDRVVVSHYHSTLTSSKWESKIPLQPRQVVRYNQQRSLSFSYMMQLHRVRRLSRKHNSSFQAVARLTKTSTVLSNCDSRQ